MRGQLPSGTVVAAREQTQGRGRMDRQWLSEANENLTFSLWVCDEIEMHKWPSATMAAAIAVSELLQAVGLHASLKWPNDVLVNGQKISGILSERIPQGLIIGIGLNVNMQQADHIDQPATSILMETGQRGNVDELLQRLLKLLEKHLATWQHGGFEALRKDWEQKVPNIGKPVTIRDGTAARTGLLAGFGPNGELLLKDNAGVVHAIWAGDLSV